MRDTDQIARQPVDLEARDALVCKGRLWRAFVVLIVLRLL